MDRITKPLKQAVMAGMLGLSALTTQSCKKDLASNIDPKPSVDTTVVVKSNQTNTTPTVGDHYTNVSSTYGATTYTTAIKMPNGTTKYAIDSVLFSDKTIQFCVDILNIKIKAAGGTPLIADQFKAVMTDPLGVGSIRWWVGNQNSAGKNIIHTGISPFVKERTTVAHYDKVFAHPISPEYIRQSMADDTKFFEIFDEITIGSSQTNGSAKESAGKTYYVAKDPSQKPSTAIVMYVPVPLGDGTEVSPGITIGIDLVNGIITTSQF